METGKVEKVDVVDHSTCIQNLRNEHLDTGLGELQIGLIKIDTTERVKGGKNKVR